MKRQRGEAACQRQKLARQLAEAMMDASENGSLGVRNKRHHGSILRKLNFLDRLNTSSFEMGEVSPLRILSS
jgi:hypothetical protein